MQIVNMKEHDFKKQNLFTQKKGDFYKCAICGCEGWRQTVGGYITVTEAEFKKAASCTFEPPREEIKRPKKVLLETMLNIGITEGIHDVVECPDEYKDRFENDIWVYSAIRKEAVRILTNEIIEKEF